jgi:hypothetical protein
MKSNRAKLIKQLDETCSLVVRQRDNKCILCGGYVGEPKKLQAHHWILSRGQSNKYRWDTANLCSLCWACHIHKIHQHPTVPLLEELKNRIIFAGIATQEDIDRISSDRGVCKLSNYELEEKLNELKLLLNGMANTKIQQD